MEILRSSIANASFASSTFTIQISSITIFTTRISLAFYVINSMYFTSTMKITSLWYIFNFGGKIIMYRKIIFVMIILCVMIKNVWKRNI